jgi:hypothetical protein
MRKTAPGITPPMSKCRKERAVASPSRERLLTPGFQRRRACQPMRQRCAICDRAKSRAFCLPACVLGAGHKGAHRHV